MALRWRGTRPSPPPPQAAAAGHAVAAAASATEVARPDPPLGAGHLVVLVLDSLRYDTWIAAQPRILSRLGAVERRWSYATWTAPSHYNLLLGLLPHTSPPRVYASEHYKADYLRYADRLSIPGIEFSALLPSLCLTTYLRRGLGYRTHARVSMPVLNRTTPLNRDFDSYELMARHNDLSAILGSLRFEGDQPTFHLLNAGETHYPYALADDDPDEWPRLSGVHGVVRRLDAAMADAAGDDGPAPFFDMPAMERLRARQVRALQGVDALLERLFDEAPPNTWLVVTSDHGELFGEDGYFGHGPIAHEKVLEVPFVEGRIR
ncbi:MAG TPA: sulfatase-like hydrolase/transferase [Candidatus Dormibacteraeota bacterium]|nr:sulfatase-like hydrolase/transferase [Candidatus Dormibacteraeota bacterium]